MTERIKCDHPVTYWVRHFTHWVHSEQFEDEQEGGWGLPGSLALSVLPSWLTASSEQ